MRELAIADWHEAASTDLEGLRLYFDSNQDGKFDADDQHFAAFRLWQDKDGDAEVDEGELQTLAEADVASVDVSAQGYRDAEALAGDSDEVKGLIKELAINRLHGVTSLTRMDGSSLTVGDVAFQHLKDGFRIIDDAQGSRVEWEENGDVFSAGHLKIGKEDDVSFVFQEDQDWAAATGDDRANSFDASLASDAVRLAGKQGADVLTGSDYSDVLDGGFGADIISGAAGDDQIYTDDDDNLAQIKGGAGNDAWRHYSWNAATQAVTDAAMEQAIEAKKAELKAEGKDPEAETNQNQLGCTRLTRICRQGLDG